MNLPVSANRFGVSVLFASVLLTQVASAQTWTDFQVGDQTRKALVYVPEGIEAPPLLISLHGRGIPAGWNQGMMKFEPIADREKFIVVYPEANNDLNWDLGGTSDIDFVLQIIEDMSDQHGIDRKRVYASGFSMGGMFSHTLACRIPNVIAAIAPGNGYPLGGLHGCDESRNVPIFHMHGTADDFVKYSGIHAFLNTRIQAYGCPSTPVRTEPYPEGAADSKSFKESWGPCPNEDGTESEVVLISVAGMIHDWATPGKANTNEDPEFNGKPFDIDGSEEAWAFLKTYSLDGKLGGPVDPGGEGTGGTPSTDDPGAGGSDANDGTGGADTGPGVATGGAGSGAPANGCAFRGGSAPGGSTPGGSTPGGWGSLAAFAAGCWVVLRTRTRRRARALL